MSDAMKVAIVGIIGSVIAGLVPQIFSFFSQLQQREIERKQFVADLFLKFRIESIQNLFLVLFTCQEAYLRYHPEDFTTVATAHTFLNEIVPKYQDLFRAIMTTDVYIQRKDILEHLSNANAMFSHIRSGMLKITKENNIDAYPIDKRTEDWELLAQITTATSVSLSELLVPKALKDLDKYF